MTYTIALVACSASKLGHAAPARLLYTSQLFRKAAQLAEATADEWFILSAEHGLVHPDTILEPYDTKLTAGTATAWALRTNEQLQAELNRGGEFELVVYAGKHYRTALFGLSCPVSVPMQGLGIGQQLGYLTRAISELEAPAFTDDELHALTRDQQASMLWFIRGWMSRPGADFDEALRHAYRDQLEAQTRLEAYKQRKLDEAAEGIARATGSRGSTYTVEHADGSTASGSYSREDVPPPLYVPTRSECNAMKEQSKRELLEAGIDPTRWDLEGMKCSHGDGPTSHIEDLPL